MNKTIYGWLLSALSEVVWVRNLEGKTLFVNEGVARLYGRPAEAFVADPTLWLTTVHPADRSEVKHMDVQIAQTGHAEGEYRIVQPDDSIRWVRVVLSRILGEDGEVMGVGGTAIDISEQKATIKTLQEREVVLKALLDSRIDLIIRYMPDTTLTYVNDAACTYWGQPREVLLGTSLLDQMPEEQHAAIEHSIDTLLTTRDPAIEEYYTFDPGGQQRWQQWLTQVVDMPDGTVELHAVGRDITDRKEAEQKLENHQQHLEELVEQRTRELRIATEAKDQFVSNVSHELRAPITNLKVHLHLIEVAPEKFDKYYATLDREVARLAAMIDDLLMLSRLDQERMSLNRQPCDLYRGVEDFVLDRQRVAQAAGVTLRFDERSTPAIVHADPGLIGQVIGVLVNNAIAYTPEGGTVDVSLVTEGNRAGFDVHDTGPGIPPAEQERIFERFYRGQAARLSEAPGTGLGLSIAAEIVERHAGTITLESDGTHGTTFTVWLPIFTDQSSQ